MSDWPRREGELPMLSYPTQYDLSQAPMVPTQELDSIIPVLNSLPDDLISKKRVFKPTVTPANCAGPSWVTIRYELLRHFQSEDWRFLNYRFNSVRVFRGASRLGIVGHRTRVPVRHEVAPEILQQLCSLPGGVKPFPNLEKIIWTAVDRDAFLLMRTLAGPSVTTIHLEGMSFVPDRCCWDAHDNVEEKDIDSDGVTLARTEACQRAIDVLGDLGRLCPSVRSFSWTDYSCNPYVTSAVSEAVRWWFLEDVSCGTLNMRVVQTLMTSRSLRRLEMFVPPHNGPTSIEPNWTIGQDFARLDSLRLLRGRRGFMDAVELLLAIRGAMHVKHFSAAVSTCSEVPDIGPLIIALSRSCRYTVLSSVSLEENFFSQEDCNAKVTLVSRAGFEITMQDLSPLFKFSNLTSLVIDTQRAIYLSYSDLRQLAGALPRLRVLQLNRTHGWRVRPWMTYRQLVALCTKDLPGLRVLALAINGKSRPDTCMGGSDTEALFGRGAAGQLEQLELLDSPVGDDVHAIARCLLALVARPEAFRVDFWRGRCIGEVSAVNEGWMEVERAVWELHEWAMGSRSAGIAEGRWHTRFRPVLPLPEGEVGGPAVPMLNVSSFPAPPVSRGMRPTLPRLETGVDARSGMMPGAGPSSTQPQSRSQRRK
ncbi:hypothetical protein CONPUDRAFT_162848 [Coniophora puteana RWD-64-598 SS2]|uniref:Uncharacterized protein n=1 Tax=Coniophora puteana (strain RWD-64-598) TaxID=741705 RepID=A0A5M3N2U4_CONPW|nr:uncharacterized protein CONPUDRAFT_162848 [Coniophora puteana RWD-64-598 SS2]EIW85709.1 hypothetical protein CONPUDRAFT_162848 [Coniophora puteana RWD-64-598 SS2]